MRILMLGYEYPPLGGGTGVACQNLLNQYKKEKGLQVELLTSSINRAKTEKIGSNVKVHFLDIGKNGKNLHHQSIKDLLVYLLKSSRWVFMNKKSFDLIHVFGGLPGSITAFFSSKPYMVSLRGGDQPGYEPRLDKILEPLKPLINIVYSRAKAVDANSLYLKKLTLKSFPKLNIKVINNGVDQTQFYPAKSLVKQPVVLCTSRFGARKGVDDLVKAMALVVKKIPKAKLILTGEGEKEAELRQLAQQLKINKQVVFKGRVDHQQMGKVYRKARLFVLPSLSESLANSLLEAMASGLPVVATKGGGNPELINQESGLLVTPKDIAGLASAIIKILKHKGRRVKMGQNSLRKAKSLSWSKAAEKYLKLY